MDKYFAFLETMSGAMIAGVVLEDYDNNNAFRRAIHLLKNFPLSSQCVCRFYRYEHFFHL